MWFLILGMMLFLGVHSIRVIAPRWRQTQIETWGDGRWKGGYSLASILGLVILIYGYGLARENAEQIFDPPAWGPNLLLIAMPVAVILLVAADFRPGYIKYFLRHPMLLGVLIWSAAHLTANGDTASAVLFGGFLIWSVIDLAVALCRPVGQSIQPLLWPDLASVVIGLLVSVLIVHYLHIWLIGVPIV